MDDPRSNSKTNSYMHQIAHSGGWAIVAAVFAFVAIALLR